MISLDEARSFVLSVATRRDPVRVPVSEALGLVLAQDVSSEVSIPPFANTAMDGFALRSDDVADAPTRLKIVGTVAAGQSPTHVLQPGEAMRIMTGAVVPEGADAIVMVELTAVDGDDVVVQPFVPSATMFAPAMSCLRQAMSSVPATLASCVRSG
jgi:molybdopterin molybdotransferase